MRGLQRDFMAIAALWLAGAVVVLTGAWTMFAYAPPLVSAQDNTVGEMLLDEALRYPALRAEKLELAKSARFQGLKNQKHLYLEFAKSLPEGAPERETWLRLALDGDALAEKRPALWREAQTLLCELLLSQQRMPELEAALQDWERRAGLPPSPILRTAEDITLVERFRSNMP